MTQQAPHPPQTAASTDARRAEVRRLRDAGKGGRAIARQLGVNEATVRRDLKALNKADDPYEPQPSPAVTHDAAPPPHDAAPAAPRGTDPATQARAARDALRGIDPAALRHDHAAREPLLAVTHHAVTLLALSDPLDEDDVAFLRGLARRLTQQADRRAQQ